MTGGEDALDDGEADVDEEDELGVAADADEAARFASAAATQARMSTDSISGARRNGCCSSCAYVGRCSGIRRRQAATKSSAAAE